MDWRTIASGILIFIGCIVIFFLYWNKRERIRAKNREPFNGNGVYVQLNSRGVMDNYLLDENSNIEPQPFEFLWNNQTRQSYFPYYWNYRKAFDPYAYIF